MDIEIIVTLCILAAVVTFYIVRTVVAINRAKKAGIVRVIRPHETDFFVFGVIMLTFAAVISIAELTLAARYNTYLSGMKTRGIPAIAEYRGTAVEELHIAPDAEDSYLDIEIAAFTKKKNSAGATGLLYIGVFVLILLMTLTSGAYVTETGIQTLHSFSQDVFLPIPHGKWIVLYNPKTKRILFKVRANSENLQLFQPGELPL